MVGQFFMIIPQDDANGWKCKLPIKKYSDYCFTRFTQHVYKMTVHGIKTYDNKSFVHVLAKLDSFIDSLTFETGIEFPFSLENIKNTNKIMEKYIGVVFCPRFEDIFNHYPELEGTELIDDVERNIIQQAIWSGNPLNYSIFEVN